MGAATKPPPNNGIHSIRDFTSAVAEMEQILTTMGTLTNGTDVTWRRQYVDLRPQLQNWITTVGTAAETCRELGEQPGLAAELRKRLNRLRSALALHQANWPVISIDARNPDYAASSNDVHLAIVAFGRLARKAIAVGTSKSR